ncbi:MAG: NADP-reducing hydrogenase subunit HndC [Elusimicrobia bacterium ADurb.Bin231]|nr:MAG: NADP-reducing hydrogenase subunit HndC [Elusimicrobia bacterium ADurb.Bin231]
MKFFRTHILVSKDSKSMFAGAETVEKLLVEEIKKQGLGEEIKVISTGSIGFEGTGVTIAVYPDGIVYSPVTVSDIPEIVSEHLLKGRVVKRIAFPIKTSKMPSGVTFPEKVIGIQKRIVLKNVGFINPENIEEYIAQDGYSALAKSLCDMKPSDVISLITASELRGRGGAGYPTGLKWAAAAEVKGDCKYIICNADEGEPGTFKDREIMEGDPHTLLEGMAIAGYAVGASVGYIYIRGEYAISINRLNKAIEDARSYGLLGKNILGSGFDFEIEIKKGAGAYVCGEESALIESIEGSRGEPRKKPPYPVVSGLWAKPTVVNNVETLANVPRILENGAEWYKSLGTEGSRGTKLFSLMGDIKWKGVIEIPFGTPLSKIVMNIAGGLKNNAKLKAVILGGVSGYLIKPEELDIPVDFNSLARIEAGPGSGSIIVLDDSRDIVDIVKNIAEFFKHESCGKCTPCRIGTDQICEIIDRFFYDEGSEDDLNKLMRLSETMFQTSFCALGQTAPNILQQSLKKFRGDWERHFFKSE